MPTDPVQVVTEARRRHGIDRYDIDGVAICSCSQRVGVDLFAAHTDERIVAVLKAAGALMPEEAAETLTAYVEQTELTEKLASSLVSAEDGLRQTKALLQEALSVLGRHRMRFLQGTDGPTSIEVCAECEDDWPCPEASLAKRIAKATGATCRKCDGRGWVSALEHVPGCTRAEDCGSTCPIPVQVQCDACSPEEATGGEG